MAELNKIRFLLFVLLMIIPAHALDVILSTAHGATKQQSKIKTKIINGERIYDGTLKQLTYQARPGTTKVIVYIIGRSRFVEIIRNAVQETRLKIARELRQRHWELVLLGIENFVDDEYHLISAFMVDKIQSQINATIETIGENHFNHSYQCHGQEPFAEYQEYTQIRGIRLLARLRSITRGALVSTSRANKMIKFRAYQPIEDEVAFPVCVQNETYVPYVDFTIMKYNFKMRYPYKKIHLIILSGNEYSVATAHDTHSPQMKQVRRILNRMAFMEEVLIILGAFNFDWIEIDILIEIILKHSETVPPNPDYRVFTCGFGMFDTFYLNLDRNDRRNFGREPDSNGAKIMEVLMGEVKERFIDVQYSDNGIRMWWHSVLPIDSVNGRCDNMGREVNFPWLNQKIAFIVYDSAEKHASIDRSRMLRYVEKLKQSDINVVFIEAINFGWYDAHIIAEWIQLNMGNGSSERIAVLGGGIFDTIFQSPTTTFNTLFNTETKLLKKIRNIFVKSGNEKRVFAANIDSLNFEVWSYPMNTINGFYEPDLMPDIKMFDIRGGRKLFFIITSAHNFHRISAVDNVGSVVSAFRRDIGRFYPISQWSVYLVGLDNFEERDSHLFADLVIMQTSYGESLDEMDSFVHTYNYGISQAMYRYKDTAPFVSEERPTMCSLITTFFRINMKN